MLSCLILASGPACGGSQSEKQPEAGAAKTAQDTKPAQGTARGVGAQPATPAAQQLVQSSVKAADFESLKTLLPDVDGWTKSDVRGEEVTEPVSYSRAQARYRRKESHIEFEITDTGLSQLLLAPLSVFLASGYAERSDDGFKRAVKIAGQPGMEDWNAKSSRGEVVVVVVSRFVVKAVGHDVEGIDPVRKVVEAVSFSSLGSIK